MEWLPQLDVEKYNEILNDFELHKVKELQRSLRNYPKGPKRAQIEKEIYEIYHAAVKKVRQENDKEDLEQVWHEMIQKAFDQLSRINASLLLTLFASGIVTLLFVILIGFSSIDDKNALVILADVVIIMGIVSIVTAFISYQKIKKLKKEFESGKL